MSILLFLGIIICLACVHVYMGYINFDVFAMFCHFQSMPPLNKYLLSFICQLVVFQFDDHMAIPFHTHHELKRIQIFLLSSLVVCLIAVLLLLWSFSPQSPIGACFRWWDYRRLSYISSVHKDTDSFATTSRSWWNLDRYHFLCDTFPSMAKPEEDSCLQVEQVSKCLLFSKTQ